MCRIYDNIKCKGCISQIQEYYEENESDKKELNKILKERNLGELEEQPQPTQCLCIRIIGKCQFCYL